MRNSAKKVLNKCRACQAVKTGKRNLCPSFHGIIGRKAGSESHFKYSPAMKSLGIEWTEENLEKYLQAPKKSHGFNRVEKNKDRSNFIALIKIVTK